MTAPSSIRAGVAGFRGYSGAELLRLLALHPFAEPVLLEHRSDTQPEVSPRGGTPRDTLPLEADAIRELDVAFLATPPEVSMELTPMLLDAGVKVVDLSGAFRLRTPENYKRWYKAEHAQPGLLAEAVYGLPEFFRDKIRGVRFVSNPGCYPTAANLAIRPLIEVDLIDLSAGIVCDAKSGVSGAGRKPALKTHFSEVTENFSVYSMLDHRHVAEVLMNSHLEESEFTFVAQLIPIHRGILETIYFRGTEAASAERMLAAYEAFYSSSPFVRLYDPGVVPDIRSVQRTNYCDIGFRYDAASRRGVVVSVIDNLGKGAAGQAIQNMNLVFGFVEEAGLI